MERIKGHKVSEGKGEGEAIVHKGRFAFFGDINPSTGRFTKGHELEGKSLADKVFIFTKDRGSSQSARAAYEAKQAGNAPAAMICLEVGPIGAAAAILANIPMVHRPDKNPFDIIETGDFVKVDANQCIVEVKKKA